VPLLMRIWVEFTTNDYIGAPIAPIGYYSANDWRRYQYVSSTILR